MATNYWLDVDGNWTNTANWSLAAVPVAADDVYILAGSKAIITNLNQSAVTLASLTIGQGFTGTIGTASAYLQISATAWTIGRPTTDGSTPTGSSRIKINFGSVQFTGTVLATSASTSDSGYEAVRILGTHASNKLYVLGSSLIGVGTTTPAETSTISELDVNGATAVVNYGVGVTWTTANVAGGGTLNTNTGGTTLAVDAASTANTYGSAAITNVNNSGTARLNHRTTTSVATLNAYPGSTTDFSGNPASTIVTTLNFYPGAAVTVNPANPGHITFTTRALQNCGTLTAS